MQRESKNPTIRRRCSAPRTHRCATHKSSGPPGWEVTISARVGRSIQCAAGAVIPAFSTGIHPDSIDFHKNPWNPIIAQLHWALDRDCPARQIRGTWQSDSHGPSLFQEVSPGCDVLQVACVMRANLSWRRGEDKRGNGPFCLDVHQ